MSHGAAGRVACAEELSGTATAAAITVATNKDRKRRIVHHILTQPLSSAGSRTGNGRASFRNTGAANCAAACRRIVAMRWALAAVTASFAFGLASAANAYTRTTDSTGITGFGATVKVWNATHVDDHRGNVVAGCCFDPTPVPGLIYGDRYNAVLQPTDGLILSYSMHLPSRTPVSRARTIAMHELPNDARVQSFTVHGKTCAILIASSSKLQAVLERHRDLMTTAQETDRVFGTPESASKLNAELGEVVVELPSDTAATSYSSYDPTAVDDLLLTSAVQAGPTAQNC